MQRRLMIVATALAVLAAAFVLRQARNDASGPGAGEPPASIEGGARPRLVDLGSDQCIPCKKMAPILESLADEYRGSLAVEFIDVRKNPEAGEPWGIRVIPTQVFLDAAGRELFRHEGFLAKEAILAKWAELGFELRPSPGAES